MITQKWKRTIGYIAIGAVLVIVCAMALRGTREQAGALEVYSDYSGYAPEGSYLAYLAEHEGQLTRNTIIIPASEYMTGQGEIGCLEEYNGENDVVLTEEGSNIEWKVEVPETAYYQIKLHYLAYEGNGLTPERTVYIDGEIPFEEAEYIDFRRRFRDVKPEVAKDLNGNDIRPEQEELQVWQEMFVMDASGYFQEPLQFYLTKGTHTISLRADREPLLIEKLVLTRQATAPGYAEYLDRAVSEGATPVWGEIQIIQAEDMAWKSERSNYPVNDTTSGYTQPQNAYASLLNNMGGTRWQNVGSCSAWTVKVQESGLYRLGFRYKQDYLSGVKVSRRLSIDGEVPFEEAGNLVFDYSPDWQCCYLGGEKEPYLFYFEAGKEYSLELTAVLGDMSNILRRVETSVEELNRIYRSILMVAGAKPDKYRDYSFDKIIPETLESLTIQAQELADIKEEFLRVNGRSGERMAQLTKMEYLTRRMAEEPEEIAGKFGSFKDNIAALAAWVLETSKQPLAMDYLALVPENASMPAAEGNFFEKLGWQLNTFAASFVIDYSQMGVTEESLGNSETISVWISTGRDQMNTIRTLINSSFTKQTGISVELELVNPGTLLPSVLAGTGPDVALANGMGDPINLALRNAVYDLSSFPDYEETTALFADELMVPYQYQGSTYALPETVSFNMLFYRKDIFDEMGLSVPTTWTEWDNVISELSKKNMTIGLPHDQNMLLTFMYQRECELYNNNGESVNLDSRDAVLSFEKLTEYFTLYDFPTEYDFVNRFRTGEMPLAIADYTVYNQLSLFAPEIQGEWGMALIPGSTGADGTVNRTIPFGGTASVILNDTEHPDAAWTFLKWWVSADVQAAYCNEMESVINASAKQPTANLEALKQCPWRTDDLNSLLKEWENLKGTPEVPGGYYVGRIYTFAFNKVYNEKDDPADTLQRYIESINAELTRKRKEFGIINVKEN